MKKSIAIVFVFLYAVAFGIYHYYPAIRALIEKESGTAAVLPPAHNASSFEAGAPRILDVDAMAARMKNHQDVYKRLRDESLQAYAAAGARPGKDDALNGEMIRMAAYMWVWGDYYNEGLWQTYENNAQTEVKDGVLDGSLLVYIYRTSVYMSTHYSANDSQIDDIRALVDKMDRSNYPAEFKMISWVLVLSALAKASEYPETRGGMARSYATIPEVMKKVAGYYEGLIRAGVPDDLLYAKADMCLEQTEANEAEFVEMGAELDRAFQAAAPDSPARYALEGEYYIDYAWMARGSGTSDTVTEEGSRLMAERLDRAAEILEAAYVKYPNFCPIAVDMIRVELGQGRGTARMETWFQRAMKADPDSYAACRAKGYYLLPRWYGSPEESWQFGLDCVKTQNWQGKLPMMLAYAANDLVSMKNADELLKPEIWTPLEQVFRDWLARYPESAIYRSEFVKFAALSRHWDVVKEQCAILGNNWDRDVFDGINYPGLKSEADEQTQGK